MNQFEVKDRLIASMNPVSPVFAEVIGEKADLYGPFWIGSFLIFLLTITGSFTEIITFHALGYGTVTFFSSDECRVICTISRILESLSVLFMVACFVFRHFLLRSIRVWGVRCL